MQPDSDCMTLDNRNKCCYHIEHNTLRNMNQCSFLISEFESVFVRVYNISSNFKMATESLN